MKHCILARFRADAGDWRDVSPMHHRWKDRFGPLLEKKAIFDFEE